MELKLYYKEVFKLNISTLYYVRYSINLSVSVVYDIVERGNYFIESA